PPLTSRSPTSSETTVKGSETSSSRRRIAASAAASTAVVSSPPSPSPTTGSRSTRVGIASRTAPTSSTQARHTASQSGMAQGEEEEPRQQLGEEVRALLRHRLASRRDVAHGVDRRRPQQHRHRGFPLVDAPPRLLDARRVGDPLVAEPVDERGVQTGPGLDEA